MGSVADVPLVSVVIIFLNAERFIEEAIASVFAQSYGNWELLLVDDGSTDSSTAIALSVASQRPANVRYLEHDAHANRGMSASRNLGIGHAKGDFVAFLDADDVWLPRKLEQQVAILEAQPEAAMVYGATEWWYSWTGKIEDVRRDFVHELGVAPNSLIEPPTLLIRFLGDEGLSPCTCSILVRRQALIRTGGFVDSFRGLYEDQAFCAKLCLDSVVFASGECWYRYRQHPDSALAVAERAGAHGASRKTFLNWLASYLSERQVDDALVWEALETERRRPAEPTVKGRLMERGRALWRLTRARFT